MTRYSELAVPGVQGLTPYEPGKPLEALAREYGIEHPIKLASNENPLGPSPQALETAREALEDVARYPDGNGLALKEALAQTHGLEPARITLGNGSNDVLELLARAFAGPGNEVVFSEHAFAVYPIVTQAVGARALVVPARDWGNDLRGMREAITERTRIVFIANPNNPTGTWSRAPELRAFLKDVPGHVLVVVDEAYYEYAADLASEADEYPNTLPWTAEFPNLVVTRTFSKIHGLAGLRIGYGVSDPQVAEILNRVRQPFNVNHVALAAAEVALQDLAHVAHSCAVNREGMRRLTHEFAEMGLSFIPSLANFVSVQLPQPGRAVYERLLPEGIIVRPVDNYGMPEYLRVTIGLPEENERFIDALRKALRA